MDLQKHIPSSLRMETMEILASDLGEASGVPDILGETILQNGLTFLLDEEDEIFEGYGQRENAYPYRQYSTYGTELRNRRLKTAVLENRYLQAVFLPELGGRLWSLVDKETGKNLLYTNDALRFRNLAVRNAWFSGGVEWNVGVIGHTPYTTEPLYTATLTNACGDPVLRMYEYERVRGVCYQMDFWLGAEDRALNCRMRIVNESAEVVPMYWWSNIAVPEQDGGRVIVPAERAFTCVDAVVTRPGLVVDGVDVTRYNDIPRSVDYFFDIPETAPKYIAAVDREGCGLLHLSTGRLRSRKLFSWGHTPASRHWQDLLTKDAGDYIEIQAGLGKTQYGCVPMAPHTAWEWLEQYGPIQLAPEQLAQSNGEVAAELSASLRDRVPELERKLRETKLLAKTPGALVQTGSGHGALAAHGPGTAHLEFRLTEELKPWKTFRETGVLHQPDPQERPDEFWEDEETLRLLETAAAGKSRENWYAHYQLGVCRYVRGDSVGAERALLASWALRENPWACHALGCLYTKENRREEALAWTVRGLALRPADLSYLKAAFKLLLRNEGWQETADAYAALGAAEQGDARLRFCRIQALHRLGRHREALALMEEDLEIEDIREGDAVEPLWAALREAVGAEPQEVPYRYRFKA